MSLDVFCGVALGLSLLLIVAALGIVAHLYRAELKNTGLQGRRRVLTPFQVFVLCFFFAAVIVLFPIYYVDYLAADTGFVRILKSVLLAVQNVLRLVTLNGEFDNIRDFIADGARLNATLGAAYSIYIALIFVVAPLITAGFVLSFFRDASAMLRYSLTPCKELYVFSELNERSLTLAKDILSGDKKHFRILIFTDVMDSKEERQTELVFNAKQLGAICVKKDVTDLGLKYAWKNCTRKIYLIGTNEVENIQQALKLIEYNRGSKYDKPSTEFYVFAVNAESGALLDSIEKGKMKVRRVNENRNLAMLQMQDYSIFNEIEADIRNVRKLRYVIVGLGGYGTELLKMICCCGQMPGFSIEVHIFDKEDVRRKLQAAMPEFVTEDGSAPDGEADYQLEFHGITDVRDKDFTDELCKIRDITRIYVMLGDDERNIETAMRIRTALKQEEKKENKQGAPVIPIFAVVSDNNKAGIIRDGGIKAMENADYGVTIIGSLDECYSIKNIEQEELEREALKIHKQWSMLEDAATQEAEEQKFENYEYYRRSSMAQLIYRNLLVKCLKKYESRFEDADFKELLGEYEHRRWNTYMRSEGYIKGAPPTDHIAKTHPRLVPYNKLSESEKEKDK